MLKNINEHVDRLEAYSKTLTEDAISYWQFHRKRFVWTAGLLVRLIHDMRTSGKPVNNLLDIGNSFQTLLLEEILTDVQIDTMGFFDHRYSPRRKSTHIAFDLTNAIHKEKWPAACEKKYDIIVMLEVIEHLHVSPIPALSLLNHIMDDSGLLVIQTPNAVSLSKRWSMLAGRNPFELMRDDLRNPGHFREYTRRELCNLARKAGFERSEVHMLNHFRTKEAVLLDYLPGNLREGMTVVFKKKRVPGQSS